MIELDPIASTAERDPSASALLAARLDAARLAVMQTNDIDSDTAVVAPPEATPAEIAVTRKLPANELGEQNAKLAILDRQAAQYEATRAAVASAIGKLTATLPCSASGSKCGNCFSIAN